jgi:hypothetical protein
MVKFSHPELLLGSVDIIMGGSSQTGDTWGGMWTGVEQESSPTAIYA